MDKYNNFLTLISIFCRIELIFILFCLYIKMNSICTSISDIFSFSVAFPIMIRKL